MQVKVEKLEKSKIKMTIIVGPENMTRYFNEAYEKLAPTVKIDGFRPGKAPRKIIENTIGIARILSEGLDLAVQESYFKALSDEKIVPISQPNIVINKYPNYGGSADEIKDEFQFEAQVEVLPEVVLKDISDLRIKKIETKKASKEDVQKVLNHFQKQSSTFSEVNREAKKGDWIEIDFEGFLKKVKIDQMCSKHHPLILGDNTLIPGFEDEIIGMKKGEKKEFKIKFPADYHSKDFAGKEAEFNVTLNEIKEVLLPPIDEEFAKKFGHDDVEKLNKAVKKSIDEEYEMESRMQLESAVIDKVLPNLKVEIPRSLIEKEVDRMISEFSSKVTSQGIDFEKYLESMKKNVEELKKEMMPQAEKNVKIGFLLGKIIEEKKWDQNDKESGRKAIDYLVGKLTK